MKSRHEHNRMNRFRRKMLAQSLALALGTALAENALAAAPVVINYNPADGTGNLAPFASLSLLFDQTVGIGTGNIYIKRTSNDSTAQTIPVTDGAQVTLPGSNVVGINPATDLAFSTDYYVQIDAGAFQNGSAEPYAGIADTTTWNFTTAAPVTVLGVSPVDNAINVAVNSDLFLTFDESVTAVAGKNIFIKLTSNDSTAQTIPVTDGAQVTLSSGKGGTNNVVGINPAADLAFSTGYYVQIDAGAFTGNSSSASYAGISDTASWNFTTAAVAAFSFTPQFDVPLSTVITSNTITVSGITSAITIVGGTYSINGLGYTAVAGTVNNGDTVTVQQTSSASYSTLTTAALAIGGVWGGFAVATQATDTTPNAFTFVDQSNVPLSTVIISAPVQITGINTTTNWTASGGTACVSSGNNCSCDVAGYAASGSILNNQYMCARHTSSGSFSTATDTLVTVGGVADTFTSTTLASDTTPTVFAFTAQTGVALSTVITSNTITVAGINTASPISIVGGTYSINAGGYTAVAGTVNNGDTVTVRQTSSASYSTLTTATLAIGGVSGAFDVTTLAADTTPDPFAFTAQTGVALSTVATSNTISVAGINSASAITIVSGAYSINGGAYTAAAGTVNNGDTVAVRQTSSASYSTLTTATLAIGGVSGAFNVTTLAAPPPPPDPTPPPPPPPDPSPQVGLAVNGGAGDEVTVGNPVAVTYQLRGCWTQEMFLVLNAPAMGIVWSYLNAAGLWVALPADLAAIMPFSNGLADGTYTLFTGSVPPGDYELYLGCDFVTNGHLDVTNRPLDTTGGTTFNGVYDRVVVHVR